jgi:predicted ATP-dependent endonuclease of OLD family
MQLEQGDQLDQLPGARVFLALLSMVGSTPKKISEVATSEQLISKLEAVETRLSRRIFKYWSQNKHLKVRFRFDAASPGDPAPFNSGKVFQTRIENMRHEATIRLDERSTGFIWFFSFLVWFSEVQRIHGENLIVLLDEPGLTLHARAQSDLLRYMKTELMPNYQVLYTTHSPFMIDPSGLLSCRTVEDASGEDDEVLGTKVGDRILSTDGDTLFPLQAALGYELTQSLFIGKDCLLVEGPSDLLYLQWASEQLRSQGRTALDKRWTITPCGGITKVPSFMALFGGNRLHVAVLTDYGQGDKRKVRELRESKLLQDGHVFTPDMYCEGAAEADVEDMLGRSFYTDLVKATYGLTAKQAMAKAKPEAAPERVTAEVENYFHILPASIPEYDHFTPSRYLLEHAPELTLSCKDDALNRFEKLFEDLNNLL